MKLNPYEPPQQIDEPRPSSTPGGYLAAFMVVLAAALAMAATIPGRTQGLALITQRLIEDIPGVTKESFAWINCWGTLIGGLFCLPCGWLLDRIAPKYFALLTIAALGAVTLGMSQAHDTTSLMIYITLTRGLGQSMLSVISLTLMAKWFRRDSAAPMAGYAIAMTMLMVVGFGMLQAGLSPAAKDQPLPDWRPVWGGLGWALLIISPLCALLAWPVTPGRKPGDAAAVPFRSATVWAALSTGSFWIFALSISLFGLVSSGVSLFQEEIFKSLGLDVKVFFTCQLIGLGIGLLSNFFTGWLARKVSLSLLLGISMAVFAASLVTLPLLRTPGQAYLQAVVHAFAGGAIVVLFYLIWVHSFGPKYVGEIQGAVQLMTVIASAIGPPVVILGSTLFGGYAGIIWLLAVLAALLAAGAFVIRVPVAARGDWSHLPAAENENLKLSQETA
ncbi:MFS transporter [Anatilimnocola floriformis]|uniref:MFS transporter n=1 Tax=Anatilimnocola floriformis TaxID=2948575 RepID=UPI0020C460F6|nr:MFS transporter [Anatilimnocola floriformis]